MDKKKLAQQLLDLGDEGYQKAVALLRGTKLPEVVEDFQIPTKGIRQVENEFVESAPLMIDNVAEEILPVVNKKKSNLLPMIGAAGTIGAGVYLLNQDDEQPPVSTSVPAEILQNANRQMPQPAQQSIAQNTKQSSNTSSSVSGAAQPDMGQMIPSPEVAPDDFDARIEEARQADSDRNLLFGLLKAAQEGGAAIAGSKANTGFADKELTNQNKYASELEKNEKLRTERKELLDQEVLRDPKSGVSQQARDIARKVGLKIGDNVTAKQLADAGLPIGNLLTQKMSIDARKEQAQLQREMLAATREEKSEQKAEKASKEERDRLDKMTSNLTKSKDYEAYQGATAAKAALDEAIRDNNKTKAGSAFMIYAKIAQGDNSVVRESDMKNLAGSYNYASPTEMLSKLAAKAQGGNFSSEELKQMREVSNLILQNKGKRVASLLKPISTSIDKYKIQPEEVIDPALLREFKEFSPGSDLTTIDKSQKEPTGTPVTIRSKKTGTTKVLAADKAAKYLSDPEFERVQ